MSTNPNLERTTTNDVLITDKIEEIPHSGYRFLGGLLIAVAVVIISLPKLRNSFGGMLQLLLPMLTLLFGIILYRLAGQARTVVNKLAKLSLSEQILIIYSDPEEEESEDPSMIPVQEINQLVLMMLEAPLDKTRPESPRVEAFTLICVTSDKRRFSLITPCIHKDKVFKVANQLSNLLKIPITQAGKGMN